VSEIDVFANQLLEEAKRFLEKAEDGVDSVAQRAYLHAALMLSFCALEAHVNALGEEFSGAAGLSAHEQGILLERDVRLEGGKFELKQNLRIARLEDRIEFLHTKFSGKSVDRQSDWWQQLSTAMNLRNQLTHAKDVPQIGPAAVKAAVQAVVNTLDSLYRALYRRSFPLVGLAVKSQLTF
jgi:uncharacterized protein YukE